MRGERRCVQIAPASGCANDIEGLIFGETYCFDFIKLYVIAKGKLIKTEQTFESIN
jgi:hypothetical protein